jgi:cellulose synthase/poly-beta-1,6-N-acetylglucosamine synthase-like glycosyltransferase
VEIIVADDGSTDSTPSLVQKFGDAVIYLALPHSGQPATARNRGLDRATGPFIAFLDSDDLFLPDKLAGQLSAFTSHPQAALVYSDGSYFRDDPGCTTGRLLEGLPTPSGDVLAELLRGNFLVSPAMLLLRRSCLEEVGPFDEDPGLWLSEDYELWLRIAARFPIVYAPGTVACVRRHPESLTRDVATLRARSIVALGKLEDRCPQAAHQRRAALNEGYARNHGAIAVALWKQRELLPAARYGLHALRHSLRTPLLGTVVFREWIRRRGIRGTGARP